MKKFKTSGYLTALVGLMAVGCVSLPGTGERAFILTTTDQEAQMGQEGYKDVLSKSKINKDPRLNAILQRVGKRIAAQTGQKDFAWEFTLIESKEQNAWCMPGGKVAFYTGILPALQNEAGMAGVMGHEVAHAIQRHSGQRISQQMLIGMGLSVADLSFSNSQYRQQLLGLMGAGATVGLVLPFSRKDESEADDVGFKYMAKAGYEPQEIIKFWQRFAKAGGAPPEFLSTHPGAATRVRDLQAKLPEMNRLYEAAPNKVGIGEKL